MKPTTQTQLDAYLDRVLETVRQMQRLDVAAAQGRDRALAESQNLLAAVARYRHQLKHLQPQD